MPYPVLVAALGAIAAASFALFGLHSWTAMKIAPMIGAIIGLVVALASLRRYGLPFGASLEEYRSAAGVRSFKEVSALYLNIAISAVILFSLVELPFVFLGQIAAYVCIAGWIAIVGYTLCRAWQISDPDSFGNLDVFQLFGGVAVLMILGAFLYAGADAMVGMPARSASALELARMLLLLNMMAAAKAMVIAIFSLHILYRFQGKLGSQER